MEDRRAVLRKLQEQRKESLSVTSEQQQRQAFDAKASLVSLAQFNASDFQDDQDYGDDRYDDRNRTDTLKLVLYDLNSAIAPRELRLLAIRSAMDEFDHDEEILHDEELDLRADHILLQKLCYAMSIDPRNEEVGYICAAMEMVYRAGKKRLAKSFHEICDAILPMFVEMIKRPPYVEQIVEAVEEKKEEMLVMEEEEDFRGIEPNEDYDPYAPVELEEDDESAESVSIPAGTGEYFDHMKKMASKGGQEIGDGNVEPATGNSNELVVQPVNLNSGGAVEPYNPANAPQQGQQYTPQELYVLAEQIAKMQAQQASQPQSQMVGMPGTYSEQYLGATEVAAGQIVPMQSDLNSLGYYAGQPNQYPPNTNNVPYAGQMVPMEQGQMGSQPVQNNMPYVPMQQGQVMSSQPHQSNMPYADQPYSNVAPMPQAPHMVQSSMVPMQPGMYSGQPMPQAPPPNQAGQMVFQPTQSPLAQVGQTALVTNEPSQEVMSAAHQLTNLSVVDATDEEALRLRGGGEGSDDGHDDRDVQGVAEMFDELYEEANANFPSASSYHEYVDEVKDVRIDTKGINPNVHVDPYLDTSDVTGDSAEDMRHLESQIRSSLKSSSSNPMNEPFDSAGQKYDGNQPDQPEYFEGGGKPNMGPIYDDDGKFEGNYSDYLNMNAQDEAYNNQEHEYDGRFHEESQKMQPSYDADGNFADNYSEYMNNETFNDEYGAQANFNNDYSEYLNNEGHYEEPMAGHDFQGNDNIDDKSNPFADSQYNDAESNPFVDYQGERPYAQDQTIPNQAYYDTDIPTHVNDDQGSLGGSLRSGLTNDFSYAPSSRKNDKKPGMYDYSGTDHNPFEQGFENNAGRQENLNEEYENNDFGNEGYESPVYAGDGQAGHNQAWNESSQSESSAPRGVYSVPTFNPENEMHPRRDSELTSDSQYDESRYDETRAGNTLHVVEEEDDEQHDDMAYAEDEQQPHDDMAYDDYNIQENFDDDIFQFQEPAMMKPTASKFTTRYAEGPGLVCPLAVRKVLKILRYFSRVLSAMEQLAQQPGLVDALLYQMSRNPHSTEDEDEISARVDAIACVVNLACAEENKIMLVYHPGLLDAVINIANFDPIEEAREHAAIVMMNLAYAEENKVHMVNQDNLLDTLVYLLSDVSPFTRRYASAALFTLACTYANTAVMARHCDGGILEALRKVLLNDPVDEARINAAEALFNMARNNSDDTVENMGNHPKLLASLAHSVLTDYSADVRAYSARALEWLSADIHYPMQCHGRLLQALTTSSQWTKTTCIAEALKMQASLPENRRSMVEHPGLLDALAQLALLDGINDDEVKTCAISAMERLSKEPSTRHLMARNEGVMTALTRATFADDGYDDDEDTPHALLMKTALKNLAEHL